MLGSLPARWRRYFFSCLSQASTLLALNYPYLHVTVSACVRRVTGDARFLSVGNVSTAMSSR